MSSRGAIEIDSPVSVNIAPRVMLYPSGSPPPSMDHDWLTLPQLPRQGPGGHVFGDGSHPTTRLCAGVVDRLCRQRRPLAMLDVGTGTGVLARIARARGAELIVATDIDPLALSSARAHSELDGHPIGIHLSAEPPDHWGARFDLVAANILEAPLRQLAPALSQSLLPARGPLPGGVLLLSGFTRVQSPALQVLYAKVGLTFVGESRLGEWTLLMFERP